MKTTLIAAAALLALSALPALAGEAEGGHDYFGLQTPGVTTAIVSEAPDTGSVQYPNVAGRPGSLRGVSASSILQETGNEVPVQSVNSLPVGAERGDLSYVQLPAAVPLLTASR